MLTENRRIQRTPLQHTVSPYDCKKQVLENSLNALYSFMSQSVLAHSYILAENDASSEVENLEKKHQFSLVQKAMGVLFIFFSLFHWSVGKILKKSVLSRASGHVISLGSYYILLLNIYWPIYHSFYYTVESL